MHDNFSEIESTWTCYKLGTQNFCLGVIYRPPNSTDIYIQKLLYQLSYMCDYYDKYSVIICGDFNFPNINWKILCPIVNDIATCKFLECVLDIGLIQVIDFKTRKENILDLVLCKTVSTLPFAKAVAPLVKSDHECIKFVMDIYHNEQQNLFEVTSMYNFKKANWVKMLNKLSNINWFLLFSQLSVNEKTNKTCSKLLQMYH